MSDEGRGPGHSDPVRSVRQRLVDVSRRHTRVDHEAEDLAHDLIVAALRRGQILTGPVFARSAHGAARKHAAFVARCAVRRRARELRATVEQSPVGSTVSDEVHEADGVTLSPALETTLLLLMAGLSKAELRFALGLSDTALRKRFEALRGLGPLPRPARGALSAVGHGRLRASQVRLLPRLACEQRPGPARGRLLAVGDPDGHGIIFTELLTSGGAVATTEAPIRTRAR